MIKLGMVPNNINIQFLKYKKHYFLFSSILVLLVFALLPFKSFNLGVDFIGGAVLEFESLNTPYEKEKIFNILKEDNLQQYSIKKFDDYSGQILISNKDVKSKGKTNSYLDELKRDIQEKLNYKITQSDFIGPSMSSTLILTSIYALIGAFFAIFIYLWLRFDWQYGVIGIIALLHDVLISLLFLNLFAYELNITTIAALLTIIGYSINDTVVIFDQIRENIKQNLKKPNEFIINRSINDVISRSLATSITVVLVLLPLFLFGGNTLHSFSFTLLIGVIFGTYSSICLASPLLLHIGNIKTRFLEKKDNQLE